MNNCTSPSPKEYRSTIMNKTMNNNQSNKRIVHIKEYINKYA